jgi:hypothetical protein
MKNGEIIDFKEYKDSKKIKKLNNVTGEKESFLKWLNELPPEFKKRAEEIGIKKLETIRNFGKVFHFSSEMESKTEAGLKVKTKEELLEMIKQADLDNVKREEAAELFIAVQKILYQESTHEK